MRWTLSRAPAWASSEVASLRPRGPRAGGPWGPPCPPRERAPRVDSGGDGAGAGATPGSLTPPARRARRCIDPISGSPMVGRFPAPPRTDGPPVMPKNSCTSKNWGWWPGAESNHRQPIFSSRHRCPTPPVGRRPGKDYPCDSARVSPDRTHADPRLLLTAAECERLARQLDRTATEPRFDSKTDRY